MGIFKRRKVPQTRIVWRGGQTVATQPTRPDFAIAQTSPRCDVQRGEFRGFGSPPGKF